MVFAERRKRRAAGRPRVLGRKQRACDKAADELVEVPRGAAVGEAGCACWSISQVLLGKRHKDGTKAGVAPGGGDGQVKRHAAEQSQIAGGPGHGRRNDRAYMAQRTARARGLKMLGRRNLPSPRRCGGWPAASAPRVAGRALAASGRRKGGIKRGVRRRRGKRQQHGRVRGAGCRAPPGWNAIIDCGGIKMRVCEEGPMCGCSRRGC